MVIYLCNVLFHWNKCVQWQMKWAPMNYILSKCDLSNGDTLDVHLWLVHIVMALELTCCFRFAPIKMICLTFSVGMCWTAKSKTYHSAFNYILNKQLLWHIYIHCPKKVLGHSFLCRLHGNHQIWNAIFRQPNVLAWWKFACVYEISSTLRKPYCLKYNRYNIHIFIT